MTGNRIFAILLIVFGLVGIALGYVISDYGQCLWSGHTHPTPLGQPGALARLGGYITTAIGTGILIGSLRK